MPKLTADDLPPIYNSEKREGFYAEFDETGRCTHWGNYVQSPIGVDRDVLEIDYTKGTARAERYDVRRFNADILEEGDQRTVEERYRDWVLAWIFKVSRQGQSFVECTFCGSMQHETEKIIAGPRIYICDQCSDLCNAILAEEASGGPGPPPEG